MPGIFGSGNAEFGSTSKVKKTPQTEHHVPICYSRYSHGFSENESVFKALVRNRSRFCVLYLEVFLN